MGPALRKRRLSCEPLEDRQMLSATIVEYNDVGYLVNPKSPQLERYDVQAEQWLAPLALENAPGIPTVIYVDADGIFAAYDRSMYRYELDGSNPRFLLNFQAAISRIQSDGNWLFVSHATMTSVSKFTNTVVDAAERFGSGLQGYTVVPSLDRLVSPVGYNDTWLSRVNYNEVGRFVSAAVSSSNGLARSWLFPDEMRFIASDGAINSTEDLSRLGTLSVTINDVDFLGNSAPVVLSGNKVTAYDSALQPTGSAQLTYSPSEILLNDDNVITITADAADARGYVARLVSLESLSATASNEPAVPKNAPYQPSGTAVLADGRLLILSRLHQSLFVWDPIEERYDRSISLKHVPVQIAYSAGTNTVFFVYANGSIGKIDLSSIAEPSVSGEPEDFAPLEETVILHQNLTGRLSLSVVGSYLLFANELSQSSGVRLSAFTFDGALVQAVTQSGGLSSVWSNANQKLYFGRNYGEIASLEINGNGAAYPNLQPGGFGAVRAAVQNFSGNALFVSPDGRTMITTTGSSYDLATGARHASSVPNSFLNATWLGNQVYTIRELDGKTQVQRFDQNPYQPLGSVPIGGKPVGIYTVGADRLMVVTLSAQGVPNFTTLDANLQVSTLNKAPTGIVFSNTGPIDERTYSNALQVATIVVQDDGRGVNNLSLSGNNAYYFEIVGNALRLKPYYSLDFESRPTVSVVVNVDDPMLGGAIDATAEFVLQLTDVNEVPDWVSFWRSDDSIYENADTTQGIAVGRIEIRDDALGNNQLSVAGADAQFFEIVGDQVRLKPGVRLDFETKSTYRFQIWLDDPEFPNRSYGDFDVYTEATVYIRDLDEPPTAILLERVTDVLDENARFANGLKVADIVLVDDQYKSKTFALTGAGAENFRVSNQSLWLNADAVLDYESAAEMEISIQVLDPTTGEPILTQPYTLRLRDINEIPQSLELIDQATNLDFRDELSQSMKLADILVHDDALGTNILSLVGPDAALLEIVGTELRLKAEQAVYLLSDSSIDAAIYVDDPELGGVTDAFTLLSIPVHVDTVNDPPALALGNPQSSIDPTSGLAVPLVVARINVIDDWFGHNELSLAGPDADLFEIAGRDLRLKAGVAVDETHSRHVIVHVDDPTLGAAPDDSVDFTLVGNQVEERWTNLAQPADIDGNGRVRVSDLLKITTQLMAQGTHTLTGPRGRGSFLDANLDRRLSLQDLNWVVNYLISHEGLSDPPAAQPTVGSAPAAPPSSQTATVGRQELWAVAVDLSLDDDAADQDEFLAPVFGNWRRPHSA